MVKYLYIQKVFRYQHQYLMPIYKLQYLENYLNTVFEVFVTTLKFT